MAFNTSRTSTSRGPPPRLPGGIAGSTSAHSASVRSLGYRRPRRFAARRCSGVHIAHPLASIRVLDNESHPILPTQQLPGSARRLGGVIGLSSACPFPITNMTVPYDYRRFSASGTRLLLERDYEIAEVAAV